MLSTTHVQPATDDATRRKFLGITGAMLLTAACGSDDAPRGTTPASTDGGYPRTVEHAGGEVTIEERPERIVVAGPFSELDVVLALGVFPAAYAEGEIALQPWQRQAGAEDVEGLSITLESDLESLLATRADLLVVNGTTYSNYDDAMERWSQVCPVVAMPATPEEQLDVVGRAIGVEQDRIDDAKSDIAATIDAFDPAWVPTSMAVVTYWGELYVWNEQCPATPLLERLGLPPVRGLPVPEDEPDAQGSVVSFERADVLDADLLLVDAQAADLDEPRFEELRSNPVFANLPVVRDGRVAYLAGGDPFALLDVTALSLPTAVAALERALAETAPSERGR